MKFGGGVGCGRGIRSFASQIRPRRYFYSRFVLCNALKLLHCTTPHRTAPHPAQRTSEGGSCCVPRPPLSHVSLSLPSHATNLCVFGSPCPPMLAPSVAQAAAGEPMARRGLWNGKFVQHLWQWRACFPPKINMHSLANKKLSCLLLVPALVLVLTVHPRRPNTVTEGSK